MATHDPRGRRPLTAAGAATLVLTGLLVAPPALSPAPAFGAPVAATAGAAAPATGAATATVTGALQHPAIVNTVPSDLTPDILDGTVVAIHDAGTKIIAAGSFTTAQNRDSDVDIPRNYVLAFDKATGLVDDAFAPIVDDEVKAVIAGPVPGTVYLAGAFNAVNGVTRRKIALIDTADGSLVDSFRGPAFNGRINDVVRVGGRVLVGGTFTSAGAANPRGGLASLDENTGAVDSYLTVSLTENHNFDGSGARSGVGPDHFALSPDGTQLVVIGNFRKADGVLHDQVVKLDLGPDAATVANWNTDRYQPECAWWAFDSWVRDVAFSPDGTYFVIVTTGAPFAGTLCDTAARWEAAATGTGLQPTWVDYTGGDTLLSVAISEQAVYVGGHTRWLNNSDGADSAAAGAVGRASIAALDPVNGLPLAWNPGRHPRGYGVAELYLTPDGLWLGHDQLWIGNFQYRRERIAFFPLYGGSPPHPTTTASLPGNVYQAGNDPLRTVLYRVNAGGPALAAGDSGPDWASDTGLFSPYRNFGSTTSAFGAVGSVDATVPTGTPAAVFTDERWDSSTAPEMQWNFPVTAGTTVEVRLYLANRCTCTQSPGDRVFDVAVEGVTVLDNLDLVAEVGHNVGTMRAFTVVSDGNIDIDFGHVVQNPLVDAIELIVPGPPPSPGSEDAVQRRSYDGGAVVGAPTPVANPDGTAWSAARGAFWVGGTLFYGMNGALHRRSFDGTTFGPPSLVDPYHDPLWDTVETDSGPIGQTYAGVTVGFYPEIRNVTGMTYTAGRLYYTLLGQSGLFWRWFTPDSGVVGASRFTVAGATGFADAAGLFVSGNTLYVVSRNTGNLSTVAWVNGRPSGSPTIVSGPALDGVDWRANAVFIGP
ncbi:MAG TPA: malectin domain-containing carbohydrate-binding protein [Pilimelia sp.]|nr:malectin domain-containing carbohydrate-binding protein [Pilimelia sp.]